MADMKEFLDSIIKYGGYPILLVWVWTLDKEQEEIKDKLYECFDDKELILKNKVTTNDNKIFYVKPLMLAVLTKEQDEYNTES